MEQGLAEKYISLILANRPDISRETLNEMIRDKMKKVKIGEGYKTIYSIFLVAQELGVKLEQISLEESMKISRIVPGLRGVNVVGRIIGMSTRSVTTRTGEEVGLSRIFIGDETGWCTLVLWRERSQLPELLSLRSGDIVQVQGGYSKEGRLNTIEVHLGNVGTLTKLQNFGQLPDRSSFFISPSELTERPTIVNVSGRIKLVSDSKRFVSKRGESERRNLVIVDDGIEVSVVLWGNLARAVSGSDIGRMVYVVGARTRLGMSGKVELSLDEGGNIELGEKPKAEDVAQTIGRLKEGSVVRLECKVAKVFDEGVLNLIELGARRFRELIIYDESGWASLTVWDKAIDSMPDISEGDNIEVIGARVRSAGKMTSLSLGAYGSIKKLSEVRPALLSLKGITVSPTKVKDIEADSRNLWVEGIMLSSLRQQDITTRDGRVIPKAEFNLADDTGLIRAIAWREDVEKVSGLTQNTPVLLKWVDAKRDQFAGEIFLLISRKTEIEKR